MCEISRDWCAAFTALETRWMVRCLGAQFQDLTFDGCFADLTGWQILACIETSLAQATAILLRILFIAQLCSALIARETLSVEDFPLSMNAFTSDRLVTKTTLWRLFFPIMAGPAFEIGVIVTEVRSVNTITTNRAKETLVVQSYTIDCCMLGPNGFFCNVRTEALARPHRADTNNVDRRDQHNPLQWVSCTRRMKSIRHGMFRWNWLGVVQKLACRNWCTLALLPFYTPGKLRAGLHRESRGRPR